MLDPGARWSAPAFHPFYPRLYFLHIITIFWSTHVLDIMSSTNSSQPYLPRCNTVGKTLGFLLLGIHSDSVWPACSSWTRLCGERFESLAGAWVVGFIPVHADHRVHGRRVREALVSQNQIQYRYQNRWRWFRGGLNSVPALCVLPDVCSSVAESISGSCFSTIVH